MGNCTTRDHHIKSNLITSKLILLNGNLVEFNHPINVSFLLQHNPNNNCFICSADEMEFNQFAAAVEVLQPGEVYFELPLRWRSHPLQAEDMAVLAVKASLALSRSGGGSCDHIGCCGGPVSRKIEPVVALFGEKERTADGGGGGDCEGRRVKFVGKLSSIVEEC